MSTIAPNARVGLVGYGRWGSRWAKVLADAGCLAWIVDSDHGRRMLAKDDVGFDVQVYEEIPWHEIAHTQGTVVATPADTHREVAQVLLEESHPVLLEKPMATNLEDATALYKLARRRATRLMVDHTFLFSGAVRTALKWARDRVGDIRHVRYNWHNVTTSQDEGAVWNMGPHPASISSELARLRGTYVRHVTSVQSILRRPGVHDAADAIFRMADGSSETIHLSNFGPEKIREFSVVGSTGSVVCRPNQREVLWQPARGKYEMWVGRGDRQPLEVALEQFLSSGMLPDEHGENAANVVAMLEAMAASGEVSQAQEGHR